MPPVAEYGAEGITPPQCSTATSTNFPVWPVCDLGMVCGCVLARSCGSDRRCVPCAAATGAEDTTAPQGFTSRHGHVQWMGVQSECRLQCRAPPLSIPVAVAVLCCACEDTRGEMARGDPVPHISGQIPSACGSEAERLPPCPCSGWPVPTGGPRRGQPQRRIGRCIPGK